MTKNPFQINYINIKFKITGNQREEVSNAESNRTDISPMGSFQWIDKLPTCSGLTNPNVSAKYARQATPMLARVRTKVLQG